MKAYQPIISVLVAEIRCPAPKCKKVLKLPEEVVITPEKIQRPGLEEVGPSGKTE